MNLELQDYLKQVVLDLEAYRKQQLKAYKRYKSTTGVILKVFKVLAIALVPVSIFVPPFWLGVLGLLFFMGILDRVANPKSVFENHFKEKVLPDLFKTINPTFEYHPYHLDKDNLLKSGILKSSFLKGKSKVVGEDYIKGVINDVDIECSEMHFYRIEKNWVKFIFLFLSAFIVYPVLIIFCMFSEMEFESIGWLKLANEEKMFYRGFLMTADFHKAFKGELIMIPKHQKQISDKLSLNINTKKYRKITLENPVINDLFEVYTKSEQEGFYILSPTMLSAIEELYIQNNNRVPMVTFSEGKMNVFIPKSHDSFEANIHKEIEDISYFTRNIRDIMILPKLTDHFKLEERLWSK